MDPSPPTPKDIWRILAKEVDRKSKLPLLPDAVRVSGLVRKKTNPFPSLRTSSAGSEMNQPVRASAGGSASMKSVIRLRMASSGNRPMPPPMLSSMFFAWLVDGVTTVTAG